MILHDNITCAVCGYLFSYKSTRRKPKTLCSSMCIKRRHYLEHSDEYKARASKRGKRPEVLASAKEYREKNKARLKAKAKAYRSDNSERLSEVSRRYYQDNKAARQEYWNGWVSRPGNRDRVRSNSRAWAKENVERRKTHEARRRALKAGASTELVVPSVVFDRDNWVCALCNESVPKNATFPNRLYPTIDHIIPLSKGGSHTYENVQLAHQACNSRKGNR